MTDNNNDSGDARLAFYEEAFFAVEPNKQFVRMFAAAGKAERIDSRHEWLALWLEFALRAGIKEYSARQLLKDVKAERNALPEVMDAWKAAQVEEANATADLNELLQQDAKEPDVECTTERLTPLRDVTLLNADGGIGKTMLALIWLICIASNLSFFGLKTTKADVLFVTGEDRRGVLAKRLEAICKQLLLLFNVGNNRFADEVCARFHLWEILGKPLWIEDRTNPAGVPTSTMFELERRIKETNARQVVIDNASAVFQANHNGNVEVYAFLNYLRRLAERTYCNILVLAHVNADTASGGKAKTYFGSTAWHNAVRSRIFMELRPAEDGVDEHIRVTHVKSNYGPLARPFNLQRDEATGYLRPLSDSEIARAIDTNTANVATQLLADITAITAKGEHVVSGTHGPTNCYSCLSNHFPARYPEADKKKRAEVKAAIQRLRSENAIEQASRTNQYRKVVSVWLPLPKANGAAP